MEDIRSIATALKAGYYSAAQQSMTQLSQDAQNSPEPNYFNTGSSASNTGSQLLQSLPVSEQSPSTSTADNSSLNLSA
jgi:hypothetical protein